MLIHGSWVIVHSYGRAVITEAGNDPKVAGLVYITAFTPDRGESVSMLIKDPSPGVPVPPILAPQDGYLFLDKAKFPASLAGDVDTEKAVFMADSQVPWGVDALSGTISEAAWKTKPSWYLVAIEDKMIPSAAQRFMSKRAGSTVVEVAGSHAIYVSQPYAVAALIEKVAMALIEKAARESESGGELSMANAGGGDLPGNTTASNPRWLEWCPHSDTRHVVGADEEMETTLEKAGTMRKQ